MDQKAAYEKIITGKLEHIVIPDMSDMIWARIEKELDTDPGDGNDGGGNSSSPVAPSPAKGIILGGTAIVLLISFLVNFSNNKNQEIIKPAETLQVEAPVKEPNQPQSSKEWSSIFSSRSATRGSTDIE